MIDLANKVAVVTGAANGLGKALATELFRQGCHLATRMFWLDMVSRFFPTTIHHLIGKNKKRIDFA